MNVPCSPKCDGFMAASNKTDASIGAVDIPHEGLEEYDNIWQKVRSMWSYVYDNYYEKYDWFHIGGDDLYLIIENLRLYLESEEILTAQNGGIYLPSGDEKTQTPLFLGRRFKYLGDPNDIFNSGGSGYTMNKAALKLLVVDGFPNYFPHLKTFSEDTMVARILRKMGVYPYDTKDEEGGERYNPFEVRMYDSWLVDMIELFLMFVNPSRSNSLVTTGGTDHRQISAKTGTPSIQSMSNGAKNTVRNEVWPTTISRKRRTNDSLLCCITSALNK